MTGHSKDAEVRNLVAQFIEEVGADSVVVLWSSVKRNKTSGSQFMWGNLYACRALVASMHEKLEIGAGNAPPKTGDNPPKKG